MLRPFPWPLSHKAGELPLAPFQFLGYAKGLCIIFSMVQKEFKDIVWISSNLLWTLAARRDLNLEASTGQTYLHGEWVCHHHVMSHNVTNASFWKQRIPNNFPFHVFLICH